MAKYAELDENNVVINVVNIVDEYNEERELELCKITSRNPNSKFVKTFVDGSFRKYYAGIGFSYDEEMDVFVPPQPYPSWSLNRTDVRWEPPVLMPTENLDKGFYLWNEENQNWDFNEFPPEPPKVIGADSFRNQLSITEKLLWDNPDTASTSTQKAVIATFKNEFPLTIGTETTNELLGLLVSEGIFTQQRLDEILDAT